MTRRLDDPLVWPVRLSLFEDCFDQLGVTSEGLAPEELEMLRDACFDGDIDWLLYKARRRAVELLVERRQNEVRKQVDRVLESGEDEA